jgi:hypothetical protein
MKNLQGSTQLEKAQKLAGGTNWTENTAHPIYTGKFWISSEKRFGSYKEWKYANSIPMWEHTCKMQGRMSVGEGEECNWCGAVE